MRALRGALQELGGRQVWFVVHVKPRSELQAVELLKSSPKSDGLEEVFCPMAEGERLVEGAMVEAYKPMLDGCVFVIAPSKWELRACMKRAQGLEVICDGRPVFEELEAGEEAFINQFCEPGKRLAGASEAAVDGAGWLTVQSGPLHGREGEIVKRSERHRWAYLATSVAGKPMNARLGLRVTRNEALHPWER